MSYNPPSLPPPPSPPSPKPIPSPPPPCPIPFPPPPPLPLPGSPPNPFTLEQRFDSMSLEYRECGLLRIPKSSIEYDEWNKNSDVLLEIWRSNLDWTKYGVDAYIAWARELLFHPEFENYKKSFDEWSLLDSSSSSKSSAAAGRRRNLRSRKRH